MIIENWILFSFCCYHSSISSLLPFLYLPFLLFIFHIILISEQNFCRILNSKTQLIIILIKTTKIRAGHKNYCLPIPSTYLAHRFPSIHSKKKKKQVKNLEQHHCFSLLFCWLQFSFSYGHQVFAFQQLPQGYLYWLHHHAFLTPLFIDLHLPWIFCDLIAAGFALFEFSNLISISLMIECLIWFLLWMELVIWNSVCSVTYF